MKKPLYLEKPIKIHAYDIDAMGYVSNIVYVRWFEDLRTHFLDVYYPFKDMMKRNQSPVLAHTSITYQTPLTIHDHPTGSNWVNQMGPLKWEMEFRIETDEGIHCEGVQQGYYIDIVRKKPIQIPKELTSVFEKDRALR